MRLPACEFLVQVVPDFLYLLLDPVREQVPVRQQQIVTIVEVTALRTPFVPERQAQTDNCRRIHTSLPHHGPSVLPNFALGDGGSTSIPHPISALKHTT